MALACLQAWGVKMPNVAGDPPALNVLVNDPNVDPTDADTQSETTIVAFGSTVLVGFNDSGAALAGNHFTGFSRSTTGGTSFVDMGNLPNAPNGDAGDPVMARDDVSGTIYFSTLMDSGTGMQVFRSFDDGATFTAPVNGAPGFAAGAFLDKPWIAVDNFPGLGQGNVYMVLTAFGGTNDVRLTRSTDGGQTWGPNGGTQISAFLGQGGYVTVGPDHSVYVFWLDFGFPQAIRMRRSTDFGVTFGPPITVVALAGTGVNGDLGLGFRSNSFPQAAVNSVSGDIYVVFNDDPRGPDNADVFLTQSTATGTAWSPPVRLNDDSTPNDQWQPAIGITPNGQHIGVFWYDRRLDPANFLIDRFGVIGDISGSSISFQPNLRVTDSSFPPVFGVDPFVNPTYMGDYDQVAADDSAFFTVWGDNRNASRGRAGNQADVRFASVTVVDTAGPRVIATTPADASTVNGPVSFIDFRFSEPMDTTSFAFVDNPLTPENENDVVSFTGPGGADLSTDITGFTWLPGNTTLRLSFRPQGPSGDYSITIGPGITDRATVPNPMDQDQDGVNGESPDDEFSMRFSISTPRVISVRPQGNSVVVSFNKDLDPATLVGNTVLERSGGDLIFGNFNDVLVANSGVYDPTAFRLTFSLPGLIVDDLYRVRLKDIVSDVITNRLDGEYDGPPPAGNNNVLPSGDGVVAGDFLYLFSYGSAPIPITAPPEVVRIGDPLDVSNQGTQRNESGPTVAIDPLDPQKLVATYQINEQAANLCNVGFRNTVTRCVAYSFSTNGGATWVGPSVLPIPRNPNTVAQNDPGRSFDAAISPSVAFDGNHNFYIVYSVVTPADAPDENAILMRKFDFSGSFPSQDASADHTRCPTALFCAAGAATDDVARNPVIVVDTNPPVFTDPTTGVVYRDPFTAQGTPVYVAWDILRRTPPNVAGGFNPNGIEFAASADGGVGFSAPFNVNDFAFSQDDFLAGFFGSDRNVAPRLAVSPALPEIGPGVPDPTSARVHLVWEDFGSGGANSDFVVYDRTVNDPDPNDPTSNGTRGMGTLERTFSFVPIFDSFTSFSQIFVAEDFTIRDVNLEIRLNHPDLRDVQIDLISPAGTVVTVVELFGGSALTNLGSNIASSDMVGTKIDDEAPISLQQGAAPYANGVYQPFDFLSTFDGEQSAGSWTLEITDLSGNSTTAVGTLFGWALQLSGDIGQDSFGSESSLDSTRLKANAPLQIPANPLGVSMSPTIAVDNTLGSYSPNQGAVYVAYTTRLAPAARPNDTDIVVARVDPDLGFILNSTVVNDDHTNEVSTGVRSQFQPSLAVDPMTGTVVVTWLDARNDAANARVATYMASSVDGGQTWSKNDFLNRPQLENDNLDVRNPCIACINMGPVPDNQSAGNPVRDTVFGFGPHQSLVVSGGRVHAAWASNENQRDNTNGDRRLDIRVAQAVFAAGPRIIDSDASHILNASMGPVTAPLSSFTVHFDRPVDPSSITPGSEVVTKVFEADFETGNNGFTFDNRGPDGTQGTVDDGLWHRSTGRGNDSGHSSNHSMYYGRNEGPTGGGDYNTNPGSATLGNSGFLVSPLIPLPTGILTLSFNYFLETEDSTFFDDAAGEISTDLGLTFTRLADKTTGLRNPSAGFESFQTDLSAFGGQNVVLRFSFNTIDGVLNNFEGWYVDDINITSTVPSDITLVARDEFANLLTPQPTIQSVTPRDCNQFGCSSLMINFTPSSETGTYSYTVGPLIRDRIRVVDGTGALVSSGNSMDQDANGITGRLPDDRYFAPRSRSDTSTMPIIVPGPHVVSTSGGVEYPAAEFFTPVPITDGGTITSTFTITDRYPIPDLDVLLDITHPNASDLTVRLSHTDRLGCTSTVTLLSGVGGTGDNFVRTILDDTGASGLITSGAAPFTGSFRPQGSLATFKATLSPSASPPCSATVPTGGNLEGIWTLTIVDALGNGGGTLNGWSLIVNPDPTFDPLDENLVLNGTASFVDVTFDRPMDPNTFKTEDMRRIIGPAGLIGPRPQDTFATGPIRTNIPDGNGTSLLWPLTITRSAAIHDLNVQLDITHPNVSDLTVRLRSPDPDGAGPLGPVTVTLLSGVGGTGDNLIGTILDDEQPVAINAALAPALAPFAGRYRPQLPLSAFDGLNIQGTWTLEVIDSVVGNEGRLEDWSLKLDPIQITPNPRGTDADPNFPRTYRISFPKQVLSGTYQINVGPNIASQGGELMDQDRDAGVKALRSVDPVSKTFTSTLSTPRPTITNDAIPLLSSIVIDDNFIVRDVDVQFDITHLNVSDLRAFLVFTDPRGTQTRIELFSNVGGTGDHFRGTIVDDEATFVTGTPRIIGAASTAAPFLGRHRPECFNVQAGCPTQQRLSAFDGKFARGTWTLELADTVNNTFVGTLNSWSLAFQTPGTLEPKLDFDQTGLGNIAADTFAGSFRIFVMDQTDVRATSVWTPVGPAAIGVNGNAGRTGAIAVDPSDPSGNTVFAAGATGGVWKTTNFLTPDLNGPTWIPLSDFGPTNSLSVGSIALFPRNNDPNQTIVYVATGEGDAGFGGRGFLKSMDGGATWKILDSTDNTGPFAQRTHDLTGSLAFKIIVDYTNPDIVYASLSGSQAGGGVWRSFDGGLTWENSTIGTNPAPAQPSKLRDLNGNAVTNANAQSATDLAIDPLNPEVLYAAFAGLGVYRSPDKGFRWDLLRGGVGNAQFVDGDIANFPSITVNVPPGSTPNGPRGRISLAKPPTTDPRFQGWIYAVVARTDGSMDGVYQSKDFGQNWVHLNLNGLARNPTQPTFRPLPTNDEAQLDVDPFCVAGLQCQGNYDQSIAIDAVNPNVVYIGGMEVPALIRIDTTRTYDAHAVVAFDNDNADSALPQPDAVGSVVRKSTGITPRPAPDIANPVATTTLACEFSGVLVRRGYNVFSGCQSNVANILNNGDETQWQVVSLGEHVDHHDIFTMVDPVTGKSRLIVGTDGGFWSGVDDEVQDADGALSLVSQIGTAASGGGSRNGNLQITQFYYGAVQPSQLAADVSGTMFFGNSQDNGLAISSPDVLNDGQSGNWPTDIGGDGGGVATDPTGSGIYYAYFWPCCSFSPLRQEFFLVSDTDLTRPGFQGGAQVNGLFQFGNAGGPPPIEWPLTGPTYGANFAVNPRDGQQLAISSLTGRVYKLDRASDPFTAWFQIGEPAVFGNSESFALAYGAAAPDPNPNDAQQPDDILYVGTSIGPNPGRVLVTFTEGGNTGTEWFNISCSPLSPPAPGPGFPACSSLDGSSVRQIVTNLKEGSKEAFAVTFNHVFHMPDSAAAVADVLDPAGNGTNDDAPWEDITGNLFQIANTLLPGWNADTGTVRDTIPQLLRTIQVDDRYQIPNSPNTNCSLPGAACHPLIYVGGDAGVYRTFDLGQTWELYPSVSTDGAPLDGGFLPNASISDLDLATGPFDPGTGLNDFTQSLDILSATTFGRGTFAIRTSPLILSTTGSSTNNPPDLLASDDTGVLSTDNITRNDGSASAPLRFTGLTMRGSRVDLFEEIASGALRIVGTDLADPVTGVWTVGVDAANPLECGPHRIRAQATTFVGTQGPLSDPAIVSVLNERPTVTAAPDLLDADDSVGPGGSNTDNRTNDTTPRFTGTTICGGSRQPVPSATMRLMVPDPLGTVVDPDTLVRYRTLGTGTTLLDGTWTVQVPNATALVPDGTYSIFVRAEDLAGNIGPVSPPIIVIIDTAVTPPPAVTAIDVDTCDPLGSPPTTPCAFGTRSDQITADQQLVLIGTSERNSTVTLRQGTTVLSSTILTNGAGAWTFDYTGTTLLPGTYSFTVSAVDQAGNTSAVSTPRNVVVDITVASPSAPDLRDTDDTCAPPSSVATASCDRGSHTDNLTRVNTLTLTGTAEANSRIDLFTDAPGFLVLGATTATATGTWSFTVAGGGAVTGPLVDGLYNVTARATDLAGNVSNFSVPLALVIDTTPPLAAPSPPDLDAISDTFPPPPPSIGTETDNITRDNTPTITGTGEPGGIVIVFRGGSVQLGTAPVNSLGSWTFTTPVLSDGVYNITAVSADAAGNVSGPSPALVLTIDTTVEKPSVPDLTAASDTAGPASTTGPTGTSSDNITNTNTPTFVGTAEALGRVEVFAGVQSLGTAVVGDDGSDGVPTDGKGAWSLTANWSSLADGAYTIRAQTTDRAGNVSALSGPPNLVVTLDRTPPAAPTTPDLQAASDSGSSNTDNITNNTRPSFSGTADRSVAVTLFRDGGQMGTPTATSASSLNWTFTVPSSAPLTDGTYSITATATDVAGNVSLSSNPLSIRIDIAIAQPSAPDLVASSDTGQSDTDNITRDNTPTLTGTAEVDSLVTVSDAIGPLGTATAIAGVWTLTPALVLIDGVYSFTVRATDVAGNVSTNSDPLTPVTVDTAITPPVITGVFEDRGPNSGDGITNDTLLVFNGTAEANSTLRFTQVGVGVIAPAVTVTTAGAWSVGGPSGLFFAPGNYSFTAAATDEAGNVSAASATFNLTVDTTSPVNGLAPTLQLADDTGVVGDRITKQHRPRLIGTVADNLGNAIQVQIGDAADTQTLGTATAAIDGSYVVQFNLDLPDGRQTVVTRATDAAGNTALSPSLDFTVDATAPRVTGFSLTGTSPCSGNAKLCTTTSQIVVTFDDLDQALPGDPTFPGSVLNRGNFRLFGASHGTIDLSTSGFVYATADRLTINLAARLPNDTWTFTIDGTGPDSLQDVAGNILDGEASTFSPTSPSGNGVEGGDFIQTFTIAVPLPTVTDNVALSVPAVRLRGTRRVVSGVSIEFTQPLDPRLAVNPALYELRDPGKDGRFDTPDDRTIRLALPTYRPPTATTRATVDLQAIRAFSQNKFFRLTIDGSINPPSDQLALSDLAGNRLDGDGDGNVEPNDDFHALVGRGRKFSYFDGNGDRVGLSLVGGGFMDVVRNGNGEGRSIRLERDVLGQSVVPGRSALVGSVTAISGDGRTKFDLVTGTDGVNLDNFQRPPFVISNPIAAVVVDRLLESGDNVNTLLADSLTDPMRRRS